MGEIIERALLDSALFAIDGGGLITRSFPYPIVFINTEQYEAGFAALGDRYWGLHGVGDDIAGFPGKVWGWVAHSPNIQHCCICCNCCICCMSSTIISAVDEMDSSV